MFNLRKSLHKLLFFILLFILPWSGSAQTGMPTTSNHAPASVGGDRHTFVSYANDPLKARIYKLSNGLTVYLSVYKDAPRIQTYIAVKAGSKNDPSDATGLAHYLEHMLFKGTDKFGSKDYTKEKEELDKIQDMFEHYRTLKDSTDRKIAYHEIDSVSGEAAKYAIANEYDKMMSAIGAKGTNAFTSVEQTVYVNDIPSNQIDRWLTIESERFRNPVMRLFHTELEAVYEEKNIGLDDDNEKMDEALQSGLFQKHTYGTQTTIGTIEHLKNPSLTRIKEFLASWYVPNNMAICMSGDFDPDSVINMIDKKFGGLPAKPIPNFVPPVESPISAPIVKEVYGPEAEVVEIGYRFGGASSKDAEMIMLIDKILANGTAGLLDLDLNQQQKVLSSSSYIQMMKDYSEHVITANPREGQKLEDLKDLLLTEIGKLKKGDFPDWLLSAIITDMKLEETHSFEHNSSRADAFVNCAVLGLDWKYYMGRIERLSKITKEEIVNFANKNYSNNYVVVYKRTGDDKNVVKVTKPAITPVEVNREDKSPFLKSILNQKVPDIQPVFVDYKNDIQHLSLKNGIPVNYKLNEENNLFSLYYVVDMGTENNKKIGIAVNYLQYLGTSKYTPAEFKQELYKLGCSFGVFSSEDQVYVSLTGLQDNFNDALALFESLLADPQPNKEALENLVSDIQKLRGDNKLSKDVILWNSMYSYAEYGKKSPFTDILSEKQLKDLKPEDLLPILKELTSYQHHILYYGPADTETLKQSLNQSHKVPSTLKPVPAPIKYEELPTDQNKVYVVNHDMKQAEILMMSKNELYNSSNTAIIRGYNEYFGGGMSSIVFQDMRESKALAYSVFSNYSMPEKKDKAHYNFAYIGTQADKLPEAMKGMTALLTNMPESETNLTAAKEAIMQKISTERITRSSILWSYENAQKKGLDYDIRKDVFAAIPTMNMSELKTFQNKYIKNNKYTIMVLGDKNALDIKTLEKYGPVKFLTLEDVFGY